MKDILGQDIEVGDVVVATNKSGAWKQFNVVTRLGSETKVQVNGCSYIMAEYILKINEQYIAAKGQEEFDALVGSYENSFIYEQVKKSNPQVKYIVSFFGDYSTKLPQRIAICVSSDKRTGSERAKEYADKILLLTGKSNNSTSYYNRRDVYRKKEYLSDTVQFCVSDYSRGTETELSMKSLSELGIGQYVDQIIPDTAALLSKLVIK